VHIDIESRLVILTVIVVFLLTLNPLKSFGYLIMTEDKRNLVTKDKHSPLTKVQELPLVQDENKIVGAYIPDRLHLEDMNESNQTLAIREFLKQGFDEYFFVMDNFRHAKELESTERLLNAADYTELKIIIILLPPSEGGPLTNYDWKGWINYFNDLKARHASSFSGFAIDDFNWISTRNDTKFWRNIDFMLYSNFTDALKSKRTDVKFYPVVYFEGLRNDVVVNEYSKFIDTIVLVSASYYNVSKLERNLSEFKQMFPGKPTMYIVYPTITYNYTRQGYDPPSDRLVMATLSIATKLVDGIIIWHKIDSHVIQDYLNYREDASYMDAIYVMEQLQIADEKDTLVQPANKQIVPLYFSQKQVPSEPSLCPKCTDY
jgi:hypothetical protein